MRAEAGPALWPPKAGREGGGSGGLPFGGCEHSGFSLCCWEVRMGCLPPGSDRHPPRWLPRGPRGEAPSCDRAAGPASCFCSGRCPRQAELCSVKLEGGAGRGEAQVSHCPSQVPAVLLLLPGGGHPAGGQARRGLQLGSPPCPAGSDSHPPCWPPVVPLPGPVHPRDGPPPSGSAQAPLRVLDSRPGRDTGRQPCPGCTSCPGSASRCREEAEAQRGQLPGQQ